MMTSRTNKAAGTRPHGQSNAADSLGRKRNADDWLVGGGGGKRHAAAAAGGGKAAAAAGAGEAQTDGLSQREPAAVAPMVLDDAAPAQTMALVLEKPKWVEQAIPATGLSTLQAAPAPPRATTRNRGKQEYLETATASQQLVNFWRYSDSAGGRPISASKLKELREMYPLASRHWEREAEWDIGLTAMLPGICYLGDAPTIAVLGCGTPEKLLQLAQAVTAFDPRLVGARCKGVDMLDLGHEDFASTATVDIRVGLHSATGLEDQSVSAAIVKECLFDQSDIERTAIELTRIVKTDGAVIITQTFSAFMVVQLAHSLQELGDWTIVKEGFVPNRLTPSSRCCYCVLRHTPCKVQHIFDEHQLRYLRVDFSTESDRNFVVL
eukprot:COSAG01_NODE_14358_length_1464_cov_1.582418_2_plen_380_part_00